MTREIKFRAREVNGKGTGRWVYGTYAKHNGHFVIFDERNGQECIIDPTTLGEYTGLKGENSIEIYESDLVTSNGRVTLWEVFWRDDFGGFYLRNTNEPSWLEPMTVQANATHLEVIGNIYENPELLK